MRFELTRRGDYAVRATLAIAALGRARSTSAREIAAAMRIPVGFLPRVMADLARAGLVTSRVGRSGGYRLARPPSQISLLEVIEAVEGDGRRRTCVLRDIPCNRDGHCQVHDVFAAAQGGLLEQLADASLADIPRLEVLDRAD
jgi:Rrf2 family protein